jgi:hypothetical protein
MMSVDLVLLVLALICFAAAAVNVKSPVGLVAAGLFLYVLRELV